MARLQEALSGGQVILMDGAMGTELRRAGLPPDGCGELWNVTHPEKVRAIHQSYKDAGTRCFLTNTFQANPTVLAKHAAAERLEKINQEAVAIARSVAGAEGFVLGDIGPFEPRWNQETIQRVVTSLRGVDGILLETFSDTDALWAVKYGCLPCLEAESIPVLVSITYKQSPEGVLATQGGQSPDVFGQLAPQYGVTALGVNCGRDVAIEDMAKIISCYRKATDLPLFARPNAGTPVQQGTEWLYPHSPEKMASDLDKLLEAGVAMVGGCCGTTPAHIAAFAAVVEDWNRRLLPGENI
jgi:5-methyltetrahydrofolate--homocysteine methyltransferase